MKKIAVLTLCLLLLSSICVFATSTIEGLTAEEWVEKGNNFSHNNDNDNAIMAYTNAIKLNLKNADVYFLRAIAYNSKYIDGGFSNDHILLDNAIADFTSTININAQDSEAYYFRGYAYYHGKKLYDDAINDFTVAININSKYTNAYYERGNIYFFKNLYDNAITDYTTTIALNPKHVKSYLLRGLSYKIKYYQDKINAIKKVLPQNDYYFLNKSIADFTSAINIDPLNIEAYYNRGLSYQEKNYDYEAIEDYNKVIFINPRYAEAYYRKGEIYEKLNFNKEAAECYQKYLQYAKPGDEYIDNAQKYLKILGH